MAILHDELNPRIFDERDNMRENIREALLKIVQEFLDKLNQNEIPISVVDYRLVGSNAAYNYSPKSDMDIHIIADLSMFREDKKLLQLLYDYFKSNFNDKYDIKIKGMEVELYIEDASKGSISNGVYSIKEDKWIKKPKHTTVLDIDITKSQQYKDLIKQYQELKDEEVADFIDNLYVIRKVSLSKNGEFAEGNLIFKAFRDNGYLDALRERQAELKSRELSLESLEEAVSPQGYAPKKTGKAYKVFKVKNGKLYPPMVANSGGKDTPIGVWLDAEEGEFAGLSKTGRPKVKSTGGEPLAYRPGWHLGDIPRAKQFDRLNKETGEYEFPKDFVWAECDYAMDVDYQPESDAQGYMRTKMDDKGNVITYKSDKYQHSLAGLPKLPKDGYYKYRTNPNPDTVPWVITGQMKVNRLLSDDEVNTILKKNGIAPIHRQGGDKSLGELGLQESLEESFDRYIIIHNSPSGEEIYRTDDFQDACEELVALGRAYKIVDTQDDYKEYKLSDVKKLLKEDLSKEQEDFFHNSKVRDKDGNLLVVYHGTPTPGFKEFGANKGKSQFGRYKFGDYNVNYFTSDKASAASYTELGVERDGNVYACYLNIENPFIVDNKNESDIRSSFNIKDDRARQKEIELFEKIFAKWKNKIIDTDDYRLNALNHDLRKLNLELRPCCEPDDFCEYFDLYYLGKNNLFGAESRLFSEYTTDELFSDDMYEEMRERIVGVDNDDYFFSTDDIVRYVIAMNEDEGTNYDGIIISDIIDSKSPFSNITTDYITIKSPDQIKLVSNLNPTHSNRIDEAHIVDKIKLASEQDRRRKLTDEDKEEIRRLYATGFHSLNSLAKQFGVSKKLILITVNTESKAKNDERIKNHWKDYYDTQEHTSAMRDTRAYKKDLLDKGELKKIEEVYPNKGESKKDFISRFMSVTKDEYPDVKQRYAVANSYWERRNKKRVNESNDADPQSIIAYHSSPNKFTKFDKKYIDTATSDGGMYGKGFYFADKELAQQFNYSGYLYKVKLLFSKPYILNTDKDRETFEALINAHYDSKTKKNNSDLTDFFNAGYDGVISNNEIWKDELGNKEKIHSQFVVYDPSQITILSIEPYSLDDNYNLNEATLMHWGDLDYGRKADRRAIMAGRGTGHFGTGFYFVSKDKYDDMHYDYHPERPIYELDTDSYKLFKPKSVDDAYALHDALKSINDYAREDNVELLGYFDKCDRMHRDLNKLEDKIGYEDGWENDVLEFTKKYGAPWLVDRVEYMIQAENWYDLERFPKQLYDAYVESHDEVRDAIRTIEKITKTYRDLESIIPKAASHIDAEDSISTEVMKALGFEGVDVSHLQDENGWQSPDNFKYGSVIYDLKPNTYRRVKEPRGDYSLKYKK